MWSKNGQCIYSGAIDKKFTGEEFYFFVAMEGEGTEVQIVDG